jgi:hypothetical protein
MRSGGCAGSGRALRLDPFGLPVRFSTSDAAADGRVRDIELHRERIVLRRSLRGMRMAINMPVAAFDGISLLSVPAENGNHEGLTVVLKHSDPSLTLPLFVTSHPEEALAEWQAWSQLLGVPLLVGSQGETTSTLSGELLGQRPRPRRRRRSMLKSRRPSILLRRGHGNHRKRLPIHRGEREIIARN